MDDPYEPPRKPELRLNTQSSSVEESIQAVLTLLADRGLGPGPGPGLG